MSTLAFSNYAAGYDAHFTRSPIGMLQRKRVYRYLFPLLNKQQRILEINCGTGYDALAMAPAVQSVLAVDIAPGMIAAAEEKKAQTNISNISFKVADTRTLHTTLAHSCDILFSDFGGLNCLGQQEFRDFANNIAPFIASDGKLVLVIMGKKCLWEDLFFRKQKDPRRGRRNTDAGIETTIDGEVFKTFYYSPEQVKSFFEKHFSVKTVKPIGFFIPPSYLNSYFATRRRWLSILNAFEKWLGSLSLLSNYADHFLMVLEKK